MKRLLVAPVVALLALVFAVAAAALQTSASMAEGPILLGADANISGNSATSLGTIDGCVSVNTGDTVDLDIFVSDVDELIHWELYLKFDPSNLEVAGADMHMFLDTNSRSSVTTQSIPLSHGQHFLGAADLRDAPESGSGVLARLTLRAKAPGLSDVEFLYEDFDGDGDIDKGPRLTASRGTAIGDSNGDGVFDHHPSGTLIAVDRSCRPTDTSPPGNDTAAGSPPEPLGPELARVFSVDMNDANAEDTEGGLTEGGEPDDGVPAAVLGSESTPAASSSDQDLADPQSGGKSFLPFSDGGFPLWAMGAIAAGALVIGAALSIYMASRSGGRYPR